MLQSYDALLACQRVLISSDDRYANIIANSVPEEMKKVAAQLSDLARTIVERGGPPPAFPHCKDFRITEVLEPLERWCEDEVGGASLSAAAESVPGVQGRPDAQAGGEIQTDALAQAQEAARAAVAASLADSDLGSVRLAGDRKCGVALGRHGACL